MVGLLVLVFVVFDGVFYMIYDGIDVVSGFGGGFCNGWVLFGYSIFFRSWCYWVVIMDVIVKCWILNN